MNESEIIPNTRGQIFAQMNSVRTIAKVHFDVKGTVGQKSYGYVICIGKRSTGVENNRIPY